MIAALFLLSVGVTFRETATLDRILKDLSAQTGQAMHVTGKLKGEVLLVDVHNQDLSAICDNIAKAADAEWDRSGKDWKLERSSILERKLTALENERRLEGWRASQGELRESISKLPAFGAEEITNLWSDFEAWYRRYPDFGALTNAQHQTAWATWEQLIKRSPGNRALEHFITDMDLAPVARMADNSRIVFAEPPTRMQSSLRAADPKFDSDLNSMLQAWRVEADKRGKPKRNYVYGSDPTFEEPMEGRRLIVLSCRDGGRQLIFRLWQFSKSGQTLLESIGWLFDESLEHDPSPDTTHKPFVPAPDTQAWIDSIRKPLTSAVREKVSRPDKFEPLGFLLGNDLAQIAEERQRDIVALLPDEAVMVPGLVRYRKFSADYYLWVLGQSGCVLNDDGKTLTMHNRYPLSVQARRVDRTDLTNLLSAVVREGRLGLEPLSAFVAKNTLLGYSYLGRSAAETLVPGSTVGQANADERLLRLYGLLNVDQRKALESGAALPILNLSGPQRALVEDMVFFSDRVPQMTMKEMATGPAVNGVATIQDTTELLPNGLTSESRLRIDLDTDLSVMRVSKTNGRTYSSVEDLDDLVQTALVPSNAGGWAAYRDRIPGWAVATRRRLKFVFQLSPKISFNRELSDVAMPKVADAVPFDQLSATYRKQIESAMAAEAKRRAEIGGLTRKPPP